MRVVVFVLAGSLITSGCSSGSAPSESVETGVGNAAIDAIFADWDQPGMPGCAVAVAQKGELLYAAGYGFANLDYDIPITPDTVFDVASVTKQFVAASINMLALDGKLSLDDDVRTWLPELPEYEQAVTLRHMLYHTSGFRDYLNLFPLAGRSDHYPLSLDQIVEMMARQRALVFEPGERYAYSNTAYMLLAKVIERAAGQTLGEFAAERIFEPLGMSGSLMYDNLQTIIPRRSTGYDRDGEGGLRIVHNYNFDVAGDGQLYTTVGDLLRWDSYLHDEQPAFYETMLTEGALNDGSPISRAQGLFLGEYRGLATVEHSGSSWGFRTQLRRFVEPGLAIAVACNSDYGRPGELTLRVADHYLADLLGPVEGDDESVDEEEATEVAVELPAAEELAAYAGAYFSRELDAIYRVAADANGMTVRIEQEPPIALAPVAVDAFEFDYHPQGWGGPSTVRLDFVRDATGAVTGFELASGSEIGIGFGRFMPPAGDLP